MVVVVKAFVGRKTAEKKPKIVGAVVIFIVMNCGILSSLLFGLVASFRL